MANNLRQGMASSVNNTSPSYNGRPYDSSMETARTQPTYSPTPDGRDRYYDQDYLDPRGPVQNVISDPIGMHPILNPRDYFPKPDPQPDSFYPMPDPLESYYPKPDPQPQPDSFYPMPDPLESYYPMQPNPTVNDPIPPESTVSMTPAYSPMPSYGFGGMGNHFGQQPIDQGRGNNGIGKGGQQGYQYQAPNSRPNQQWDQDQYSQAGKGGADQGRGKGG